MVLLFLFWEVGQSCFIYFKKAESQEHIIERKFLCWHIIILTKMVINKLQFPFVWRGGCELELNILHSWNCQVTTTFTIPLFKKGLWICTLLGICFVTSLPHRIILCMLLMSPDLGETHYVPAPLRTSEDSIGRMSFHFLFWFSTSEILFTSHFASRGCSLFSSQHMPQSIPFSLISQK